MGLRDRRKRLVNSFKYAFNGFKCALRNEQNIWVHLIISFFVIVLGLLLNISLIEWCICLSLFALVIGAELINTALEKTVDLLQPNYNESAKVVKDTAAAFVLIFAILSVIIGTIIFLPKLLNVWGLL